MTRSDDYFDYFVGLDLGQTSDYTALAVVERRVPLRAEPSFSVRHLQRWPLGTSYPQIVDDVVKLLWRKPLENALLVVDKTGVGAAVVDLFRAELGAQAIRSVVMTSGHTINRGEDGSVHLPKKELVGTLQALLQTRRLIIARDLEMSEILVKELQNFRVKITLAGNETFEAWRERDHDDLLFATALATWEAKRAAIVDDGPHAFVFGSPRKSWRWYS